jgi:hypothetical protein
MLRSLGRVRAFLTLHQQRRLRYDRDSSTRTGRASFTVTLVA